MPQEDTTPPEPAPVTVDEPPEDEALSEEVLAELAAGDGDDDAMTDTAVDIPAIDIPDFDDDLDGDPTDPGEPADGLTPEETVADV